MFAFLRLYERVFVSLKRAWLPCPCCSVIYIYGKYWIKLKMQISVCNGSQLILDSYRLYPAIWNACDLWIHFNWTFSDFKFLIHSVLECYFLRAKPKQALRDAHNTNLRSFLHFLSFFNCVINDRESTEVYQYIGCVFALKKTL